VIRIVLGDRHLDGRHGRSTDDAAARLAKVLRGE
jgi:hypothetical protein